MSIKITKNNQNVNVQWMVTLKSTNMEIFKQESYINRMGHFNLQWLTARVVVNQTKNNWTSFLVAEFDKGHHVLTSDWI